ncbi:GHKL domain-containing protein [bacterium]|nr:GHKL domain-containing protein [bacterium]
MKSSTIRWVILGAAVSVIGIVFTQIYWVRKAFTLEEEQFEQGVNTSLYNVAKKLADYNGTILPTMSPVKQISSNYFIVNVNDEIDANLLEHYLKDEFSKRNIHTDFDYAIYDCSTDEMVYGDYISLKSDVTPPDNQNLQKYDEFDYYFGVRFPERAAFITNKMGIWIFSSIILLIVIIFFSATIFIILRQKRLSEVQKDFINNMTHEFKTPLSTIGISADVLLQQNAVAQPERLVKYAQIIKSEANRLNNQVLRVLQMAKHDKEHEKLKFREVDLVMLLNLIKNNLHEKVAAKGGSITIEAPFEFMVKADEVHLSNILNNLLENAIQYSRQKPEIKIELKEEKNCVSLAFIDNGIGIAKEHQKKVFDKFFRVPKGNVHDVKGFGLGLNYVRNMVQAHGWKITLESELNKGTTFTILIPKHHGKKTENPLC